MSVTAATVGSPVFVGVDDVPAGTPVQILFNGTTVAQGTATDDDSEAFGGGELALAPRHGRGVAAPSFAGVLLSFQVPAVPAGAYEVRAIGPGFNVVCGSLTVQVAGTSTTPSGRLLGRTGVEIAGLLAVALACLVVGRALVEASRQRRRRHQRSAPPSPPAPEPETESELASR